MISAIHKSLAAKRDALKNDDRGFTLIELLVVVLIVGILAAVAVPVFLGQQDQAKDSAAKSDLGNAKIAMISYATDNGGEYLAAGAATTPLEAYGYVATEGIGVPVSIKAATGAEFCLEATSASSGAKVFHIVGNDGVADGPCPAVG